MAGSNLNRNVPLAALDDSAEILSNNWHGGHWKRSLRPASGDMAAGTAARFTEIEIDDTIRDFLKFDSCKLGFQLKGESPDKSEQSDKSEYTPVSPRVSARSQQDLISCPEVAGVSVWDTPLLDRALVSWRMLVPQAPSVFEFERNHNCSLTSRCFESWHMLVSSESVPHVEEPILAPLSVPCAPTAFESELDTNPVYKGIIAAIKGSKEKRTSSINAAINVLLSSPNTPSSKRHQIMVNRDRLNIELSVQLELAAQMEPD